MTMGCSLPIPLRHLINEGVRCRCLTKASTRAVVLFLVTRVTIRTTRMTVWTRTCDLYGLFHTCGFSLLLYDCLPPLTPMASPWLEK